MSTTPLAPVDPAAASASAPTPAPTPVTDLGAHPETHAVVRLSLGADHHRVAEQLRRVLAAYSDRPVVMHSTHAEVSELVLALRTQDLLDLLATVEASQRSTDLTDPTEPTAPTGPPGPTGAGVLSSREAEAVALVAAGLTNREVAGRMYLTENTLKSYIRSAYRKMGVRTRSQAVAWAFSHGLA